MFQNLKKIFEIILKILSNKPRNFPKMFWNFSKKIQKFTKTLLETFFQEICQAHNNSEYRIYNFL